MTRVSPVLLLTALTSLAPAQAPDSTFRSDGYGFVAEFRGEELRMSEVTEISCIPSYTFRREPARNRQGATAYRMTDGPVTFFVSPAASAGRLTIHYDGAASSMIFARVEQKPTVCDRPPAGDPVTTFDVFWQNYAEHYPFFALKKIDWTAARERFRPKISAETKPQELFDTFKQMIEPLYDAHTSVGSRELNLRFGGRRPDPDSLAKDGFERLSDRVWQIVRTKYLVGAPKLWANNRVMFGMMRDSIGYLRITGFAGYSGTGVFADELAVLESALDTIFAGARSMRGLVIDVRVNGGGADPLGLAIASRLTAQPYTAYAKVARNDARDPTKMTPPQPSVVRPSARPGFRGPVVELIGRYSISAAETFTQALMGRRPAVARIGEHTQGVFSDVLSRRLPNGWRMGLPNELFLTEEGTSFDGPGIPPTIAVPALSKSDFEAGKDSALERAVQELRRSAR